jgi:hypothetical protein
MAQSGARPASPALDAKLALIATLEVRKESEWN